MGDKVHGYGIMFSGAVGEQIWQFEDMIDATAEVKGLKTMNELFDWA